MVVFFAEDFKRPYTHSNNPLSRQAEQEARSTVTQKQHIRGAANYTRACGAEMILGKSSNGGVRDMAVSISRLCACSSRDERGLECFDGLRASE